MTPKTQAARRSYLIENRLKLVVDGIPALVMSALPDGSVDFVNQRWLDYTGRSLEELLGWGWWTAIHPQDITRFGDQWRAALAVGELFEDEARVRRADGEYRWFSIRNVPVRDEHGNIAKWYGSTIDIEDRRQAQDAVRRREAYSLEAQRLSHTGSFGWSVSTGQIFWSDETFRIFEYERAIKPTLSLILQRVHPEDQALVQEQIDRAFHDGKLLDLEHRLLMPDGSVKYVRVVADAVSDELGQSEFVGAITDITEHHESRAALERFLNEIKRSEERLRLVIDTIPAFVMSALPDGSVDFINQRWLEYTGLSKEEWLGYAWRSVIHPEDLGRMADGWRRSLATGEPHVNESRYRRADGEYCWFLGRTVPLYDELGNITKWYGTLHDIDDRKRAEQELQTAFDEIKNLKDQLNKENLALKEEIDRSAAFEEIIGSSEALRRVLVHVAKVAPTDSTVLISGETGTGKELVARAIHKRSHRSTRAFVRLNCAAIPPSLVASELFGHEKGAFTGATQRRLGRFELAEGGTLFLDEVGELPAETQIALLRVLQERELERVGGSQPISVDVRVLTATNRDLQAAVDVGTFRQDLFYRLNVFPIHVPPLRERVEDIPLLVQFLTERYASTAGKKIRSIKKTTLELFQAYDWPGNVRELQNVVERAVILCDGDTLSVDESWLLGECPRPKVALTSSAISGLGRLDADREKEIIEAALAESLGRVSGPAGAAVKLGIPRSTLESRIRSLGINKHRFRAA